MFLISLGPHHAATVLLLLPPVFLPVLQLVLLLPPVLLPVLQLALLLFLNKLFLSAIPCLFHLQFEDHVINLLSSLFQLYSK
jgi:hypothetical protein